MTLLDGLVLSRSAFNHSADYRSVVAHGTATVVDDAAEKTAALGALVEATVPGRTAGTRPPDRKELAARRSCGCRWRRCPSRSGRALRATA